MTQKVRLALVQMSCVEDVLGNVDRAVAQIGRAAGQGADIVCLPELFAMPYPCQREDHRQFALAEPIPGPTSERLGRAAAEHGVVVIGSLFERRAEGLYHNTAVVIDADGQLLDTYRKMHIPDDPGYYEKFYFTPGDRGFRAVATARGTIGVCVCWDQWFPEAARLTALRGALILFYPTAIGWLRDEKGIYGRSQHDAWRTMMRSHAIANGVFVAAPNRTGVEADIEFWGGSFVADPNGNVLAEATHEQDALVLAECDLALVDTVRTHWPFLRDRRIDAYQGLLHRYLDDE